KRKRAMARLKAALENPTLLTEVPPAGRSEPAPAGLSALGLALRNWRAFLRGGLAAALEAEQPLAGEPSLRDPFRMTVAEYHQRYFQSTFMRNIFWMGVPTLKMVSDLWIYQEIIHQARPDIVVEIGSHFGGSTLFLAHLLDQVGHGDILSIDISREVYLAKHPRISEITGDSGSGAVIEQVRERTAGLKTMVVHDGDHSEAAVRRDLEAYGDLVSRGQFLIVEDSIVDVFNPARYRLREMDGGPLPVIRAFVEARPGRFEITDLHRRFLLSASPFGYLKRIED
ncbi:MAG: CmcI family methyltransferase, partial [Tistlia sp.]